MTKIAIANLLSVSSSLKPDPALQVKATTLEHRRMTYFIFQTEVYTKYQFLWHLIVSDADKLGYSEILRLFKDFARFTHFTSIDGGKL